MKRLNRQNLMNNLLENFLNTLKKGNDTKEKGQIFTPFWCVDKLLDEVNYTGSDIIMKEILEPSFGDGAILTKIIIRYINECNKLNFTKDTIRNLLNRQIKGVELDTELYLQTKEKLNNLILELYQLEPIKWLGLTNEDTLLYKEKDFDFIVGNPPYLNIQKFNKYARANNLQEIDIKKYPDLTYKKGGSDLYLLFFEKCIKMLKNDGKLSFITPSTYFFTQFSKDFRNDLINQKLVKKIIDYNFDVFKEASINTCITIIEKGNNSSSFEYIEMLNRKEFNTYLTLNFDEVDPDRFNFMKNRTKKAIDKIKTYKKQFADYFKIDAGVETGNAKLYKPKILGEAGSLFEVKSKLNEQNYFIEKDITNRFIKSTTCKEDIIIYLTKQNGDKYKEIELKENFPKFYEYFEDHREEFMKRHEVNNHFSYTRDFEKDEDTITYIIKSVISSEENNKEVIYKKLEKNEKVWGGIFIRVKAEYEKLFLKIVNSSEFILYCKNVGIKYLRGNSVKLTSKVLSNFFFK
jgi:hypothetical protein